MNEDVHQRLTVLEQETLHNRSVVKGMDKKLDSLVEAMQSLVRIEERQLLTGDRLAQGAQTFQEHETRLRRVEQEIPENLDKRLVSIETKMPGLLESRGWVILGVLGGLGMMGAAIGSLILK
jgi:hypothetical protein